MFSMVVDLDPVIFSLGQFQVRWYGLMYVIGFIIANALAKKLARMGFFQIAEDKVDNFITFGFISIFIGARTFYVFIYNWDYYSQNLGDLLAVHKGGLSFHGALAGLLVGGYLFGKKNGMSWGAVMDNVALMGAQGLFFGRMGNFINMELYGRVTDVPWGMIFPNGGPYPRHPSQLYEGVLEGIVLTLILWFLMKRVKYYGILGSTFMIGYGVFRYSVEFFREPDSQLGYYFGGTTTMGQILCLIMIALGALGIIWSSKKIKDPVSRSPVLNS
jgi:phosphatidylglycerol---prolipoprotein diacylglyceryl transferase